MNHNGLEAAADVAYLAEQLRQLDEPEGVAAQALARALAVPEQALRRELARLGTLIETLPEQRLRLGEAGRGPWQSHAQAAPAAIEAMKAMLPAGGLRCLMALLDSLERSSYQPQGHHYEAFKSAHSVFRQLDEAIRQRRVCTFEHLATPQRIQPYRLANRQGFWHLIGVEAQRLTSYDLERVKELRVTDESYEADPAIEAEIAGADDVWFSPKQTEVILYVRQPVAPYFKRHSVLPEQRIRHEDELGLLISTRVTHPDQFVPVVKRWMPHVFVLEPKNLAARLRHDVHLYSDVLRGVGDGV